jgi:hypothetical protein
VYTFLASRAHVGSAAHDAEIDAVPA